MKNMKRNPKVAFIMSVISLLLCVSMFVGTTFAWFTDSITNTKNKIMAGNLDVELYYQVEGQTDWTKVDENSNIFMEDALWEPGHTEVVKLKVVNEGTLSLKYQLGVNVASETGSKNVLGKEFKLSDYIKFGVVEGDKSYDRAQAIAAVDATATALNVAYGTGTVKLDAMEWTARSASGEPIEVGKLVKVERIEGVKAFVSPVETNVKAEEKEEITVNP